MSLTPIHTKSKVETQTYLLQRNIDCGYIDRAEQKYDLNFIDIAAILHLLSPTYIDSWIEEDGGGPSPTSRPRRG